MEAIEDLEVMNISSPQSARSLRHNISHFRHEVNHCPQADDRETEVDSNYAFRMPIAHSAMDQMTTLCPSFKPEIKRY